MKGISYRPTCVIAGAGPGLGLAIAERYAEEGFISYMLCRSPDALGPALRRHGERSNIVALECDVTSAQSAYDALRQIRETAGGSDVLVYNASADNSGTPSTLDPDTILEELRVNVVGALTFASLTLNDMRAKGGTIIFSGCGMARVPSAQRASLSVGKAALHALVACLADEVENQGVRIGMVTIDGPIPADSSERKKIADLYWRFFAQSESEHTQEIRFHSEAGPSMTSTLVKPRFADTGNGLR